MIFSGSKSKSSSIAANPFRLLVTGLFTAFVLSAGQALGQNLKVASHTVQLKFAPPDGLICQRKMLITKMVKIGDDQDQSETTSAENTIVFRSSPGRVSITLKPRISPKSRRRMERMRDYAGGLLSHSDITIHYDDRGRFVSLSGLTKSAESLKDALPVAVRPMAAQLLPMEISNFHTKWENRFYQFTTPEFPIGKFARSQQKLPLPNGQSIDVTVEMGIKEQRLIDGKNIAYLISGYTSTDPLMGKALGSVMLGSLVEGMKSIKRAGMKISQQKLDAAIRQLESDFPKLDVNQFWYTNERYLDTRTMITYSESDRKVARMTMRLPGSQGNLEFAVQNRTDYIFDCG